MHNNNTDIEYANILLLTIEVINNCNINFSSNNKNYQQVKYQTYCYASSGILCENEEIFDSS